MQPRVDPGLWTVLLTVVSIERCRRVPSLTLRSRSSGTAFASYARPRNWTQEDLAGDTGLDRSYVSGLESGLRNPTYLNLLKVARSLGLPITALLDFKSPTRG
jgi:DNA-binding XRE family transcriptional regulator